MPLPAASYDFRRLSYFGLRALVRSLGASADWDRLAHVITQFRYIEARCAAGDAGGLEYDLGRAQRILAPDSRGAERLTAREHASPNATCDNTAWLHQEARPGTLRGDVVARKRAGSAEPATGGDSSNALPDLGRPAAHVSRQVVNRLRALAEFVTSERRFLDRHAVLPGFCGQQAYNFAPDGPLRDLLREYSDHFDTLPSIRLAPCTGSTGGAWQGLVKVLVGHTAEARCVAMSAEARCAVSGGDDRFLILWDLDSGEGTVLAPQDDARIFAVAVTPDGSQAASANEKGVVSIWDLPRKCRTAAFRAHESAVHGIVLAADGRRCLTAGDQLELRLWDTRNGRRLLTLDQGGIAWEQPMGASADLSMAVTAHPLLPAIMVWDLRTGADEHALYARRESLQCLGLTADGSYCTQWRCSRLCD